MSNDQADVGGPFDLDVTSGQGEIDHAQVAAYTHRDLFAADVSINLNEVCISTGGFGSHTEVGERKRTTSKIDGREEGCIDRHLTSAQYEGGRCGGDLQGDSAK